MAPAKKYPCLTCNTEVGGKGGGVQCSYCDRWVHPKCANITKAHLELYKLPSCQFVCDTCVKVSTKIKKEIQHLQVKQAEMREDIEINKEEIAATKRRMDKVERKVEDLDPAKIIEQSRDGMLRELRERETRKDNLVIHQVEEPTMGTGQERKEHDMKKVLRIMDFIQCPLTSEGIKFIFRAGERREDRPGPRPIIICLKDSSMRKSILENTRKLASSHYERISITPDLTPLQRKEEDGLRKEAESRNNAMDKEERLNFEWVLVGMKGQRILIKRRVHHPDGGAPRWTRGGVTGGRGGGRGRARIASPTPVTRQAREAVLRTAREEGEKERDRVRELAKEKQKERNREVEPEKQIEPEPEKNQGTEELENVSTIVEKSAEPSGTMDMEDETEEEEEREEEEEDGENEVTQVTTDRRDRRKRDRSDTSLSPPQANNKSKKKT